MIDIHLPHNGLPYWTQSCLMTLAVAIAAGAVLEIEWRKIARQLALVKRLPFRDIDIDPVTEYLVTKKRPAAVYRAERRRTRA